MDNKMKITLACCIATCIMTVAIPLVSEITNRGRGAEAGERAAGELIYVPVRVPDIEPSDAIPDTQDPESGESAPETDLHTETESGGRSEAININAAETQTVKQENTYTVRLLDKNTGKVSVMPLEEYIVGVVAAEMPYTFNSEALKAQAVAARSYCLYKIVNGSDHDGADVCTSYSHCASYVTEDELTAKYGAKTAQKIITKITKAVSDTAGQIITYKNKPALALFHSSSRGYTESAKNVWGGNMPYLVSVSTPEPDSVSTVTVTDEMMTEAFGTGGTVMVSTAATAKNLTSVKNDSGRQGTVSYSGKELKAKSLRTLFGLKSCDFEYERTEGGWIFTVHGYGHGVGMSQYGANEMANSGYKYDAILTHYYTGVKLARIADVPSAVDALG